MQQNDDNKEESSNDMPSNYSPSSSTGIYGSYVLNDVQQQYQQPQVEPEEKVDHQARAQIQQEIQTIRSQRNAPRERIYELAKQTYRQEGKPVVIDRDNILTKISQEPAKYQNATLPLTLAQDKPFSQWNEQQFKREFSQKFNIPIQCIEIVSVRAGSCIIDLKLNTHSDGRQLLIPIKAIAENISNEKAKKALVEFGIFAMEFGNVKDNAKFKQLQQNVIMNPQWNREYGPGYTDWDGPLEDGKSRGGEPYYCPKGWKRFAVQFNQTAYDFKGVYDKWPIAYHGTKFEFGMMISLSALMATGGDHGEGVYTSPSIKYCAHPRYAKPFKLDLSQAKQQDWTSEYTKEFKKYDGKWIQCIFMLRVKPGSYIKRKETMSYWTDFPHSNGVFDNIKINEIEWIVTEPYGNYVKNDRILIYGIMIRACNKEMKGYADY